MRFTEDKLIVDQEGGCGFGHNVIASGTYRKISIGKPTLGRTNLLEIEKGAVTRRLTSASSGGR